MKTESLEAKKPIIIGKRQGDYIKYYENGKEKATGKYKNNKKDGYWKEYGKSGKLNNKGRYVLGKKEGFWEFYYNRYAKYGLSSNGNYANAKREGRWRFFNLDGTQSKIVVYQNGDRIETIKDGKNYIIGNGYITGENHYKNNRLIKTVKYIIENNKNVGEETWINGILKETNRYYTSSNTAQNASAGHNSTSKRDIIYKIHFKNKCRKEIHLFIRFLNSYGKWQSKGWWTIRPGKTVYVNDTKNRILYFYALSKKRAWRGNHYKTYKGKRYPMKRWEITQKGGAMRTMILSCR